jgi:sterol desaturase/sphingolipid hydroxylase (fatty acid hydroxylase superfamily)
MMWNSNCSQLTTMSDFLINDFKTWDIKFSAFYCSLILLGYEIIARILPLLLEEKSSKIAVRGKHLDEFETIDKAFIFINKLITIVFIYNIIQVTYSTSTIKWNYDEVTFSNTVMALIGFYLFYDFFYMWFHRILHIRGLYGYIHKHHHRQKAPSRGNLDAINVHPFEFFVGEYLHLLTIYIIPCHIYTVAFFIVMGGLLASLNHTRYDIVIPGVYSVKVHDVHHRLPETNYGQYTLYWDYFFGSYRPYEPIEDKKGK